VENLVFDILKHKREKKRCLIPPQQRFITISTHLSVQEQTSAIYITLKLGHFRFSYFRFSLKSKLITHTNVTHNYTCNRPLTRVDTHMCVCWCVCVCECEILRKQRQVLSDSTRRSIMKVGGNWPITNFDLAN
jgi:hypothetical protein